MEGGELLHCLFGLIWFCADRAMRWVVALPLWFDLVLR